MGGPDLGRLEQVIRVAGGQVSAGDNDTLTVTDLDAPRIGELAAHEQLVLHELSPQLASLEEAFMELTHDSVQYGGQVHGAPAGAGQDGAQDRSAATAMPAPGEGGPP